jgi:hypothetical protein
MTLRIYSIWLRRVVIEKLERENNNSDEIIEINRNRTKGAKEKNGKGKRTLLLL